MFVFCDPRMLIESRTLPDSLMHNVIVRSVPAVAPVGYRRSKIPYSLDCRFLISQEHPVPDDAMDILTRFDTYPKAPPGLRDIYQVHPVFVAKLAKDRVDVLWQLFVINDHLVDYEFAALFLWWTLMPDHIYDFFKKTWLYKVNLNQNNSVLSELFEVCRQQAACCVCKVGIEAFLWLRKYKNLFGRRRGVCDVAQEELRYDPQYSNRCYGPLGGYATRREYLRVFWKQVRKVVDAIVVNMRETKLDAIDEWWEKRVNNLASGSSSNRHMLDEYIKKDDRIGSSDRPNKKAVCEVYDKTYLLKVLKRTPMMIARRSTKNEPGLKQRALYAVDDDAVMVSAFASMGVEKSMNILGMAPLQRPIDVLQWWKHGKLRYGKQIWLSADYTDFNKEHSSIELELLNLAFALSWLTKYPNAKVARQKSFAALWLAEAQKTRFVKKEDGTLQRVFSALFSGSRDTARDNTILHQVYSNIIIEWMDNNLPGWGGIIHAHMCGDDEDVLFSDVVAAAVYYSTIKSIGWHTNDSKQMCGMSEHEFLQKFPHAQKGCIAPISSMISALCSGQWYTQPGLQQDCALAAMSDQMWELIVRGGDATKVYLLTIDLLNDYMQVKRKETDAASSKKHQHNAKEGAEQSTQSKEVTSKVGETAIKKKLEWWAFRLGKSAFPLANLERATIIPNNTTFLWLATVSGGTDVVWPQAPKPFFYVQYSKNLPHKATQAWCDRWFKLFVKYRKTELFPKYVMTIKANSYGSLYHTYWQGLKKDWLWEQWPERHTPTSHAYGWCNSVSWFVESCKAQLEKHCEDIFTLLMKHSIKVDLATVPQQLARSGADPIMFELLGGIENKELVNDLKISLRAGDKGQSWLNYKPHLRRAHMLMDPALRSFLTTAGPG